MNVAVSTGALARVQEALKRGHFSVAVEQCSALLKEQPDNPAVLHYLAVAYLRQERLQEAERYLRKALRVEPRSAKVLNEFGVLRLKQGACAQAIEHFSAALEADPKHRDAMNNIAAAYTAQQQPVKAAPFLRRLTELLPFSASAHTRAADNSLALNDVEGAIRCARKAIGFAPQSADGRLSLAEALEAGGRFKQAKFQYLSVLAEEPAHAAALSKLLALQGTHISENHATCAERLLDHGGLPDKEEEAPLRLGLARYWDRQREYDRAFEHLRLANAMMFKSRPFESRLQSEAVDRLIRAFGAPFFEGRTTSNVSCTRPIFIVGMPRSGTTLVEQILASHPRVAAGGELSAIIGIAMQIRQAGKTYPEAMRDLDAVVIERIANEYLGKLEGVSATAERVTDKMPFNFMHLGLIRALFPTARIIHCRRDPLDTCVSCFFTAFNESLQFASDLTVLGRYYLDYRRLMRHWETVFTVPWLEIQYEALVQHTEGTVRKMLKFCDLDWDSACLRFYGTERGVRTPSRWQVRQPIYGNSIGRWRNYERHLQPLKAILESNH